MAAIISCVAATAAAVAILSLQPLRINCPAIRRIFCVKAEREARRYTFNLRSSTNMKTSNARREQIATLTINRAARLRALHILTRRF